MSDALIGKEICESNMKGEMLGVCSGFLCRAV